MGYDSKHGSRAKRAGSAALFSVGVQITEGVRATRTPSTLTTSIQGRAKPGLNKH